MKPFDPTYEPDMAYLANKLDVDVEVIRNYSDDYLSRVYTTHKNLAHSQRMQGDNFRTADIASAAPAVATKSAGYSRMSATILKGSALPSISTLFILHTDKGTVVMAKKHLETMKNNKGKCWAFMSQPSSIPGCQHYGWPLGIEDRK